MATFSFDGVDLNDLVTFRTGYASAPFRPSSPRVTSYPYSTRPGGVSTIQSPGPLTISLSGFILGQSSTGAWEANRDTLLSVLGRQRKRLRASFAGDRFLIATPTNIDITLDGPQHGRWSADFVADEAYFQSATPSADVRTPTLALLSGTDYLTQFSLNPGGTAPAPVRAIITNLVGSVTPTRITLRNISTGALVSLPATAAGGRDLPVNSVLVIDQTAQSWGLVSPLTDVLGWWPFLDASGNALGFGPDHYGLSVSGAPLYRQDAPWGVGIDFDGVDDQFNSTDAIYDDTGPITWGAWVVPGSVGAARGIIGQAAAGAGYSLRMTAAGLFEAGIGNTTTRVATGTRTAVVGQPYFVVGTATGGTVTTTVNGVVEAVMGGGAFSQSVATNAFTVGGPYNLAGVAEFWDGIIGEPFLVGRAWTLAEIRTAMRHGIAAVEGVPVAVRGQGFTLDPLVAASNVTQLVAAHGSTDADLRMALAWRSRFL